MKRLLLILLLLVAAPVAFCQQLINCQNYPTQVPCTTSGPTNTGNGDNASVSFGKDNANWLTLQSDGIFSGNINFTSGTFGATTPTGGNLGNGTLNVSTGYYVNGIIVPTYPRTAAEIAAGVTPTNYGYAPGNVLRYGAIGDGVADDTAAFQSALSAAESATRTSGATGIVYLPAPKVRYTLASGNLSITSNVVIQGDGKWQSYLRYTGTGTAIASCGASANLEIYLSNFTLQLSGNNAVGIDATCAISSTIRSVRVASIGGATGQVGISADPTNNAITPFFNVITDYTADTVATGILLNASSTNPPNRWAIVASRFLGCGNCVDIENASGTQIVAPYFDQQTLAALKTGASADGIIMSDAVMETSAGGYLLDINAATNALQVIGERIYAGLVFKSSNGILGTNSIFQGNEAGGIQINGAAVPTYPRTTAEISAGVTPVNYGYPSDPENILRFGTNTTPGTTDMTTALENAIAGLPSTGGKVILPAGTYLISSTIVITKPVILEGDGDAVVGTVAPTVLNKASSLHGPLFMIEGNGGNNSIIENLLIHGISGNTDNGIDVLANSVTVRNVGVTGMGQDGIRVGDDAGTYNSNRCRLDQVASYSNGRYGIYLNSDSNAASWSAATPNANGCTITSPFVANNASDGVYVYSAGANTLVGGVYEQNTGHGIHIGGWAQWIMVFGGDINEANTAGDVLIDAGATSNPQGNMFVGNDIGTYTDNSTGSQQTLLVNQKSLQAVSLKAGSGVAITNSGATCAMSAGTSCTATVPTGSAHCAAYAQGATAYYAACNVSGTTATVTANASNSATWLVTATQ